MVLTSHGQLGDTGRETGFWLEEFAAPYLVFKDAGVEMTFVSPRGGQPSLDPKSDSPDSQTEVTRRFKNSNEVQIAPANTAKLLTVSAADYDALLYSGGHGPPWDLAEDSQSISLIEIMYAAGKPVAVVRHAPGAPCHVKAPDGPPLACDKPVTGFANSEEAAVSLMEVMPFLVEDMLKKNGGKHLKGPDWRSYMVVAASLITGQNPVPSEAAAKVLLSRLSMA